MASGSAAPLSQPTRDFLQAFPGTTEHPFGPGEADKLQVDLKARTPWDSLWNAFQSFSPVPLLKACGGLILFLFFPLLLPPLGAIVAAFAVRAAGGGGLVHLVAALLLASLLLLCLALLLGDEIVTGGWDGLRRLLLRPRPSTELHFAEGNLANQALLEAWPRRSWDYESVRTRWLLTGDQRTIVPFLTFAEPKIDTEAGAGYVRRWVRVPKDDPTVPDVAGRPDDELSEAVAVDFAFPKGGHDPSKPLVLVLHGLNGGSGEKYVKQHINLCLSRGSTAAVLIARGMMKTPVRGGGIFHGARTCDMAKVVEALQTAMAAQPSGANAGLVAVGFSMGAIIVTNYVCKAGRSCPLAAAVSVSAGGRMTNNADFPHSEWLWQPFLAATLLTQYFSKYASRVKPRLSEADWEAFNSATDVISIDAAGVCPYNGFSGGVADYYDRMSGFGSHSGGPDSVRGGAAQTPLLIVMAEDDPLCRVSTAGYPDEVRRVPDGRIFLLLTRRGGHVGWPVGARPWRSGWSWMTTCAADFCDAAIRARA